MISPTINDIPDGPTLHIILQLKGEDLCYVAQVSRRFNRLIEKYREIRYRKEDFDTLVLKIKGTEGYYAWSLRPSANDIFGIQWLARHHSERKCSSRALNWASLSGHTKVVRLLLTENKPCTVEALDYASLNGYIEIVKLLLEAGSPYSDCTFRALDGAVGNGHIEIVKLLLAANKPYTDNALYWASYNGHTEVMILLRRYTRKSLPICKMSYRTCFNKEEL